MWLRLGGPAAIGGALFVALAFFAGIIPGSAGATAIGPEPGGIAESELAAPEAVQGLDYETYRDAIEPIFLRPRGGWVGSDAPCVACHTYQATTPLKLQVPMESDGQLYWTEAQSRQNFAIVSRLVDPADVDNSRLLLAPLDPLEGGRRHTGGVHWESRDNAEYRRIAEWIGMASPDAHQYPRRPDVDFEFYRHCVQPMFVNPHEGGLECTTCHAGEFAIPLPDRDGYWTEEQSRMAYEELMYLIEPGRPDLSRFLHKPLHPDVGGDLMHNGGRRWLSPDDPERQALASWIRGDLTGTTCPPELQWESPRLE